jgi:hypothetical protein
MLKRHLFTALFLSASLLFPGASYAGHGGGKSCDVRTECGDSQCPVTRAFFAKACAILCKSETLGLTQEQTDSIHALKLEVKSREIRQAAEMQVMQLEMESLLRRPTVDAEALNALIDRGSAAFAENAKANVRAYAKLKAVLTEEQKAQWKAGKKAEEKKP